MMTRVRAYYPISIPPSLSYFFCKRKTPWISLMTLNTNLNKTMRPFSVGISYSTALKLRPSLLVLARTVDPVLLAVPCHPTQTYRPTRPTQKQKARTGPDRGFRPLMKSRWLPALNYQTQRFRTSGEPRLFIRVFPRSTRLVAPFLMHFLYIPLNYCRFKNLTSIK